MKYQLKKYDLRTLVEKDVQILLPFLNDKGYIIISAWKGKEDQNLKLEQDIKASKFSRIPIWGAFMVSDKDSGGQKQAKAQAFIVINIEKAKSTVLETSDDLKIFGSKLCDKYHQRSFLYKPAGEKNIAFYVDEKGKTLRSFSTTSPVRSCDMYFTTLYERNISRFNQSPDDLKNAFTYNDVLYFPESPKSLSEAYRRYGELFINF